MAFTKNIIVPRYSSSYAGGKEFGTNVCSRCNGRMVPQEFFGREGYFSGWRCVNCGEIMDSIIYQNRGAGATLGSLEQASRGFLGRK